MSDPSGSEVSYTYWPGGNIHEITYPGNLKITYIYDELNRIHTVTNWLGQTATYQYDAAGRCTSLMNFNGTVVSYVSDDANRNTAIDIRKPDLGVIAQYSYAGLDGNGNRTVEVRSAPLLAVPGTAPVSYTYNAEKNRLNSAGGSSFLYDNEGQLSIGYNTSYYFDYGHRLKQIGTGSETIFTYNARGYRVQVTRPDGAITRYIYDASGNVLAEADASGSITRYYVYGVGLLGMITSSNVAYCYHFDGTGNTVALTDSSGSIVDAYAYDPFGAVLNQSETIPQPFKFVGQFGVMADPSGLYYMWARYYDPNVGRFISEDPIGFDGGDVNLYAYAGNNPIMRIDANGLWTGNIGISTNMQVGFVSLSLTAGFIIDDGGNLGSYFSGGSGVGVGAGFSGGITLGSSDAKAISNFSGPFAAASLGGGFGPSASTDFFTGDSDNGWVTGGGATIGLGLGGGASSSITYTYVNHMGKLWTNSVSSSK